MTQFATIEVSASFPPGLLARLDRVARISGSFIRRPRPDEPFNLLAPEGIEAGMWAHALLGTPWQVRGLITCHTFDGPVQALRVSAPAPPSMSLPVVMQTTGPLDVEGPTWRALSAIEPTLSLLTQTAEGTWAFLSRSVTFYVS